MAYLGNSPVLSQQEYRNIDNISGSFNGVTTSFALLVNGVAPVPAPQSSNQCLISVNGVVQKPDDTGATGFRLSGGNIIFSSAPTGGQSFFGVILAGADYIYAGENFPDGTVSAPSITFAQDTDTGFFRSGAGEIKYTANGTAVVTLSSNNLTAPSFIPTSSSAPTNGVYLPAANTVGISTGGSGRLFVDSSGQVGINTSTPGQYLDVNGAVRFRGEANSNFYITSTSDTGSNRIWFGDPSSNTSGSLQYDHTANSLTFHTNGASERLRIDSSGRVGIGTSSPIAPLQIVTTSTAYTTSMLAIGEQSNTTGKQLYFGMHTTDAKGYIQSAHWGTAYKELLLNPNGGNVGIGTSSPSYALDVNGVIQARTGASLILQNDSGNDNASIRCSGSSVGAASLLFNTAGSQRAVIDSSGRLGIGSTSPGDFNQVVNAPHLVVGNGTTSSPGVTLYSTTAGAGIVAFADGTTGNQQYRGYIQYDQNADQLNLGSNGPITFNTGTERARIDSSGRLLLGTSTARNKFFNTSQDSLFQVEGVSGGSQVISHTYGEAGNGGPYLVFTKNRSGTIGGTTVVNDGDQIGAVSFQGSDGSEAVEAARIQAFVDGTPGANDMPGRLVFSTTADGASSPTERMRIANNGAISTVVPGGSTLYPAYDCRAWVNFNGTGTVAIRGSGNVSSITDNGTGDYTVNFTTAMPDANYPAVFGGQRSVSYQVGNIMQINSQSTIGIAVKTADSGTGFDDYTIVNVAIFR